MTTLYIKMKQDTFLENESKLFDYNSARFLTMVFGLGGGGGHSKQILNVKAH